MLQPGQKFNKFFAISKIDEEKRIIEGIGTKEGIDSDRQVVRYEGSKEAWTEWSNWFEKVTKGESKGNLRAMHQPIAAGKVLDWQAIDSERAIRVAVKVEDDKEWKKCLAKVYTGFSIGGRVVKASPGTFEGEEVEFIDKYKLSELSLADKPSEPECVFTLMKIDDADESDPPKVDPPVKGKNESASLGVHYLVFSGEKFDVAKAQAWALERGFRAAGAVLQKDAKLESCVEQLKEQGKSEESAYAICTAAHKLAGGKRAIVIQQGMGKLPIAGEPKAVELAEGVVAIIGSVEPRPRLVSKILAKAKERGLFKRSEAMSIHPALEALRFIEFAIESELFEMALGEEEIEDVRKLTVAFEEVLAFLSGEVREQLENYVSPAGEAQAAPMAMLERLHGLRKALTPFQLAKVMEDGAMKENLDAIHRIGHALVKASSEMGSACPEGQCPGGEGEHAEGEGEEVPKTKEGEEEKEASEPSVALNIKHARVENPKAFEKVLSAVAGVGEQVKALDGRINSVDARLEKIEKAPAPIGRPPGTPVDKQLGPGGGAAAVSAHAILTKLAEKESDPGRKSLLTMMAVEQQIKEAQAGRAAGA